MNAQPSPPKELDQETDGFAAAAFLAAAIGIAILGIAIVLAESNAAAKAALTWLPPVGPLSGKVGVAVLSWLLSWAALSAFWSGRQVNLGRVLQVVWLLIALGFLLVFPPIFQSLAGS